MSFEAIVDDARRTLNDHNSSPGANGSDELISTRYDKRAKKSLIGVSHEDRVHLGYYSDQNKLLLVLMFFTLIFGITFFIFNFSKI